MKMKALYINCTLKASPDTSHTQALIETSRAIMEGAGVETEVIRAADHPIAYGIGIDMGDDDAWPEIYEKVLDARILVIGTPIWLGEKSSLATKVIERLYAASGETNEAGQYIYYNRVGGVLITGNEDGGKACARSVLYCLQHIGYTVPPQADAYWVGEAGPGPSYIDAGQDNEFTKKTTRIMSWNLIHFARMLDARAIPAEGNTAE